MLITSNHTGRKVALEELTAFSSIEVAKEAIGEAEEDLRITAEK
ncbi:MAG: hypothetical protein AB1797_12490 [bacterium]